jgi:hypothetical protein
MGNGFHVFNPKCEKNHEKQFVNLRRVSRDAVSEVHTPGQGSLESVSVISQPAQKTSDSPYGNRKSEWKGEKVACSPPDARF